MKVEQKQTQAKEEFCYIWSNIMVESQCLAFCDVGWKRRRLSVEGLFLEEIWE
jgi:hypothetical protein